MRGALALVAILLLGSFSSCAGGAAGSKPDDHDIGLRPQGQSASRPTADAAGEKQPRQVAVIGGGNVSALVSHPHGAESSSTTPLFIFNVLIAVFGCSLFDSRRWRGVGKLFPAGNGPGGDHL
jgi:hypothetical protein